jgi:two-component system chemotaxis response regulator CheB
VVEAVDGMKAEKGNVYVAPGGFQMKLKLVSGKIIVQVKDDPPENNCKPSVNVLFRTFAEVYGKHGVGILMTGMGNDGLDGMRLMKNKGCYLISQDEASSLVYGMPAQPVREGLIHESLNIDGIAERIQKLIG